MWERAALLVVMTVIGGLVYKATIGGARSEIECMIKSMGAVSGLAIAVRCFREREFFEVFIFLCFAAGCLVP